mgnify:CR=1 FL=1
MGMYSLPAATPQTSLHSFSPLLCLMSRSYRMSFEITNSGDDVARFRVSKLQHPDIKLLYRKGGVRALFLL